MIPWWMRNHKPLGGFTVRNIIMFAGVIEITAVVCWGLWAEGLQPWVAVTLALVLCVTWFGIGVCIGQDEA